MLKVVIKDQPFRTTGSGTWIEAGDYRIVRMLPNKRILIDLKDSDTERMLTIVRNNEIEQII